MTLRNLVKELFNELDDGLSWILIYKDGKSWFGVSLYFEDVDFNLYDGFTISKSAMRLLHNAYEIDRNAMLINGYYINIGWSETERNTIQRFVDGIKYQYELFDYQLECIFNLEETISIVI